MSTIDPDRFPDPDPDRLEEFEDRPPEVPEPTGEEDVDAEGRPLEAE